MVWPGSSLGDLFGVKDNIINNLSGYLDEHLQFTNWNSAEVKAMPGIQGTDRLLKWKLLLIPMYMLIDQLFRTIIRHLCFALCF